MKVSSRPCCRLVLAAATVALLACAVARPAAAAFPQSASNLDERAPSTPAIARSSASYTITGDAADSGGGTVRSSATYSVQGTAVGQTAAATTATAPVQTSAAYALKSGYVGQLYDVRGLGLAGTPILVNEGSTVQLTPAPLLDDGTLLTALAPGSVTWSVASGPLVAVSATGVATAGNVYQNTLASVRLASGTLSGTGALTVVNVNDDNYSTYAGDGIDDAWQVMYFGPPPNPLAGPLVDADGTGQNNFFKYIAGLNPLDPTSRFVLTVSKVSGQPGETTLILTPIYSGRTYTLQSSPTLISPTWSAVTNISISDSGTTRTITDLSAGASGPRFYRVLISMP